MNKVLNRLEEISTGYSVFEKDQVLTHDQLNSVSDYFDDQVRLTRIKLLGVGIACGLRVSSDEKTLKITKGAGITTDGDLIQLAADTVFDKFKLHDESYPDYDPFHQGEGLMTVYELVPEETTDERATVLSSFDKEADRSLKEMAAVLFMEGYLKDEDLCSGTDCDNLGQNFVNTIKLLLIDKTSVGSLRKAVPTPAQAASALNEIVADRPLLTSGLTTQAQLGATYDTACGSILGKLMAELPKLYPSCSPFLADVFASDPAADWTAKLNNFSALFARSDSGIQYYYDFLKDLAETWNHLRELLFASETTWCCPETDGFAKHLLLGNLVPGIDPDENRTGFYFSPIVSRTVEELRHIQFLAEKLNTLIQTFQIPESAGKIIITPSSSEESRLEERAIPYYYRIDADNPIQKSWSYRLHGQKMDAFNYSYNAAAYSGQGGAASPLTSQIGRFGFFRIEGHLGKDVSTAKASIEADIKGKNLPFTVQSVLLGAEKNKIVKLPGIRYSDLHRVHQIVRKDLAYQLEDVKIFSASYAKQVNDTLTTDDTEDPQQTKIVATQKDQAISGAANSAQIALNKGYSLYKADTAWKPAVSTATTAAAEFKQNLGSVTKTDFVTPFDSLISTSHANWLDWLDTHIQDKDDKEDEKLLFSNFQAAHPGLEHFAGVVRGGTFVLVYDGSNSVVADFMLPYYWSEPAPEEEPQEPTLTAPATKTPTVILDGIKLTPSLDKYVGRKLTLFESNVVDPKIDTRFTAQANYTELLGNTVSWIGTIAGNVGSKVSPMDGLTLQNSFLSAQLDELNAQKKTIGLLQEQAANPDLTATEREAINSETQAKELDFAKTSSKVADLLASSKEGEIAETDKNKALEVLSVGAATLTAPEARDATKAGIDAAMSKTTNSTLKTQLGVIGTNIR